MEGRKLFDTVQEIISRDTNMTALLLDERDIFTIAKHVFTVTPNILRLPYAEISSVIEKIAPVIFS